jgi:hypothetical protein
MKKHNEIVQKLANLPTWAEKHRTELAVELKPELARIHAEIGTKELTALATELPAWWRTVDETTMGRPPLPHDLFVVTRCVLELNLRPSEFVALQLLIMDYRDKNFIATRTLDNNVRGNG